MGKYFLYKIYYLDKSDNKLQKKKKSIKYICSNNKFYEESMYPLYIGDVINKNNNNNRPITLKTYLFFKKTYKFFFLFFLLARLIIFLPLW